MSTVIRPNISRRKKYWISKDRYYELKHFCLQYGEWKNEIEDLRKTYFSDSTRIAFRKGTVGSDTVAKCVERIDNLNSRIEKIDTALRLTDETLAFYILKGVTDGMSYEQIRARYGVPTCKGNYYEAYRKFFYILDKLRE